MIDAHCHLDTSNHLLATLIEHKIPATINCQSKKEWEDYSLLTKSHNFLTLSAGIHPWDSDCINFEDFEFILREAPIIGEIGLDSEWTDIPLPIQKNIFLKQLELAATLKKPVILHTKGQEKEIANIIKDYPNHYLVHWYSALDYLEDYLDMGCYFTIGPSVQNDLAVQQVLKKIPTNRLLFESDGLEALTWAMGIKATKNNYLTLQKKNIQFMSDLKETSTSCILTKLEANYTNWINLSKETLL